MQFIQTNFTFVITTFTLVSNIAFVLLVAFLFLDKRFRKNVYDFVNKNVVALLFTVSLGSLVGSLSYSNIVGFPPCELCWIQRILMYPQVLISALAFIRKDKGVVDYLLPLSILGALVSFYHSMVHWGIGTGLLACTANGGECGKVYVLEYGYITIPFMAFTCFAYLITISVIYYKSRKRLQG